MFKIRKSEERGRGSFGWLEALYTFSFSRYFDPAYIGFSDLLVINEDRIAPGEGFGDHPHNDMEIITYIIDGELRHKDSMGNEGVITPGEIQYMSAGMGVIHQEYNNSDEKQVHLLQIWIKPQESGLPVNYGQNSYKERLQPNEWCLLASPEGVDGSVQIQQDVKIYTLRLETDRNITYTFQGKRRGWLQIVKGEITFQDKILTTGDGVALSDYKNVQIIASKTTELLFFDLK